ncbi:MAG: hypothetical protein U9N61_01660 [Euryarchaeota archaeon]|nr:hypothetical protein [Euryarchaeota archaeon]
MALKNTYVELAISKITGDKTLVDAVDTVTEESPIMAILPMEETSNGFTDNYEVLKEVDGIPQTDLDAPVPEIDLSEDVEQVSLNSFSGRIVAGIDKLKLLDKSMAEYVSVRLPKHYRRTMQKMEKTWIYNFARKFALENYATDNTRVIDGGGAGDTNYSILAVKFEQGETAGLYDPNGFGDGTLFEEIFESGGEVYRDKDDRSVQSMVVKNYIGFKFANPLHVVAMVNIDASAVPTEEQLGALIDDAQGADALFMHPTLARKLSTKYGTDKIEYKYGDTDMSSQFKYYDGVPLITSRNFERGTEPKVTL